MGKSQTLERPYHDDSIDEYYLKKNADRVAIRDSSGFKFLVYTEVEFEYQDYLASGRDSNGLYPDSWDEEEDNYCPGDSYYDLNASSSCLHFMGDGPGDCLYCDLEAFEDYLEGLTEPVEAPALLADPFAALRSGHERSKQREAARRNQTIRRHRRAVRISGLRIVRETTPDNKKDEERIERLVLLKDKPWSALHETDNKCDRHSKNFQVARFFRKKEIRKTYVGSDEY